MENFTFCAVPFTEESLNFSFLASSDIVVFHDIETIYNTVGIGEEWFKAFQSIKQGNVIWSSEIKTLNKSCQQFTQLHISCQVHCGNKEEFFSLNENFIDRRIPKILTYDQDLETAEEFFECVWPFCGVDA